MKYQEFKHHVTRDARIPEHLQRGRAQTRKGLVEEVTEYNAVVTQSNPGWSIYVPEVDRYTYATHLREVEPMARDLVQVMTDRPMEEIEVNVHLPADLADAIATMRTGARRGCRG